MLTVYCDFALNEQL